MRRGITRQRYHAKKRLGSITVLSAFVLVLLMGMIVLAIDLGHVCVVRCQAQAAADSAALAAAWEMANEERLTNPFYDGTPQARQVAATFAGYHRVGPHKLQLAPEADVQFGRLGSISASPESMSAGDPTGYNAVTVTVRATSARGHASPHFFARFFGHDNFDMTASATAVFGDRISGFRGTKRCPNTTLLPFTLDVRDWSSVASDKDADDSAIVQDRWAYHQATGTVVRGSDGIPEINLYPIAVGAGNWGTIDIGKTDNSTQDLERQIRKGINSDDLKALGGSLELDPDTKSITLNGDTGISAGMKDALSSIKGNPRTIPLHRSAAGNGNTMDYEIVGFGGMRIMDVSLTGKDKYVTIQPTLVVDCTAISHSWATESSGVVQRVHLVK